MGRAAALLLLMSGFAAFGQPASLLSQTTRAQGRVRPVRAGVPFAGAAVHLPELGQIVCATPAGRFALALPADQDVTVRIEPLGFSPYELTVRIGADTVSLPLGDHLVELDGLTVVGMALRPSTGEAWAVSRTDGADLARAPATLPQALQGRVGGVRSTSGAPGGSVAIDLRGVHSLLGSSEPLVVLDGVVLSTVRIGGGADAVTGGTEAELDVLSRLADLNPADIDRLEVVRGAAASARYGPRAGNGVLVITTRRGEPAAVVTDPAAALACFQPTR
ncbi:MAG: TonB-dependent receptor plug domain-containing protein [Gemmatimonadota bacterium]